MRHFQGICIFFGSFLVLSTADQSLNNSILHLLNHEYITTVEFLSKFKFLRGQEPSTDITKTKICLEKLRNLTTETTPESLGFLDAAGKPGAGILSGNLMWIGNYELCQTLRNLTKTNYQNCKVTGSVVLAGVALPNPVKWTGCLPSQCQDGVLGSALPHFGKWVKDITNGSVSFAPDAWLSECTTDLQFDAGAYAAIIILSIIGIFVLAGTLWHFVYPALVNVNEGNEDKNLQSNSDDGSISKENLIKNHEQKWFMKNNLVINIISCFALQRTVKELTSTETKAGQVLCLNGIRAISKNWVILGHCVFYMFNEISDFSYIAKLLKRRAFALIANAYPCVDSFFVLSGFIVTFVLLKTLKRNGLFTPAQWGFYFLHRYIRLSAPYLVAILVDGFLYRQLVYGPLAMDFERASSHQTCKDYWYTYLLYVNNIVPWIPKSNTSCFGGSWYIANAMQFFLMTPFFVLMLFKKPVVGVTVVLCTISISSVAAAAITAALDLGPTMLLGSAGNYVLLYRVPWIRMTTFLVGILGGWFYWEYGEVITETVRKLSELRKFLISAPIWLLTVGTQYAVVFGLYGDLLNAIENNNDSSSRTASEAVSVSYQLLSRVAWSLSLTTQIMLCQCGLGSFINSFLSWNGWLVLSKLTYCVYLTHVGLLGVYIAQLKHPFYIEPDFEFVVFYFGITVVSYLVAAILFVCVEQPVAFLEHLAYRKS